MTGYIYVIMNDIKIGHKSMSNRIDYHWSSRCSWTWHV